MLGRPCMLLYVNWRILWYTVQTFLILTVQVCSIEFSVVYISSDYYMLSADTWRQAMTGRIDFKTVFMPFCSWVLRRGTKFYNITNNYTGIALLVLKNYLANILSNNIRNLQSFQGENHEKLRICQNLLKLFYWLIQVLAFYLHLLVFLLYLFFFVFIFVFLLTNL